jgi:hypothetical protein
VRTAGSRCLDATAQLGWPGRGDRPLRRQILWIDGLDCLALGEASIAHFCSSASMASTGRACGTSKTSSGCGGCVGGDGTGLGSPPAQGGIFSARKPDASSALEGATSQLHDRTRDKHHHRLRQRGTNLHITRYRCPKRPATLGRHDVGIALSCAFVILPSCRLRFRCARQGLKWKHDSTPQKAARARSVAMNRGEESTRFVRCFMLSFQRV